MDAVDARALLMPRRLRLLVGGVVAGAGLAYLISLASLMADVRTSPWWAYFLVIAAVGLSRAWPLRLQLGSNSVRLDWGEAALIVGIYLLDVRALVAVSVIGLALGYARTGSDLTKLIYNVGAGLLAITGAAWVCRAVAGTSIDPFSAVGIAGLVLAALTSILVTDLASASAVGFARSIAVWDVLRDGGGSKAFGLVANLTVGFAVLVVVDFDPRLLIVLPPVVLLLHQGYAGRVRARTERQTWQDLAAATHGLSKLDVRQVVETAVSGAARLFGADVVEVDVRNADGSVLRARGDVTGVRWQADPVMVRAEPSVRSAALSDGQDGTFGEIRLCFRAEVPPDERERLVLLTFADALASALRNASIHEQLKRLAARKEYEAAHDGLTNLANRSFLIEAGGEALRPGTGAVALLLLDFDHFKDVNDTLGHDAGDLLLTQAAERMSAATNLGEVLARLGGDEFALLIPGLRDPGSAAREARRRATALLDTISAPMAVGAIQLPVEASIGIAVVAAGDCDVSELLRRADVAMYQAKESGRSVVAYDAASDLASVDRLALAADMQTALGVDDQIVLELQPTIDLSTGAPIGAEALVRWDHPRRGRLTPGEFVPYLEVSDLIGPLTRHILALALEARATWQDDGADLPIAVNLSPRVLLDRDLPRMVADLLRYSGVAPHQLVLEITETAVMSELEVVDEVLRALRALGVQLSLDDFGTGYSSLRSLFRVQAQELKIDQSFVADMATSPEAAAIVRATIEMGRSLGLRVIAEGVENADQASALAQLGCHGAQGFHLHPPMSPERARDAVSTGVRTAAARAGATVIPLSPRRASWLGHRTEHGAAEGARDGDATPPGGVDDAGADGPDGTVTEDDQDGRARGDVASRGE